ncbi:hypothetical protein C0Q70_01761 [Pomacea canaliculata]|uniref:FYVE-type domain-containing protein n=1 Tax=Pomacea canaliculata TaxID=400727 RepID=A0A2T7Q0D8_POMCA|nr:vacuolar protein 8-like [Pomacea canaliculata]XP_025099021.1 vacuolar protein 8-like [Pomacea canaliculata]PVD39133.1 hypothetical protein C0Q70_01761 [Pomacea canaliculata]
MDETGNRTGGRRVSRQMSHGLVVPAIVRVDGQDLHPARVEGTSDVFRAPMFELVKSRWVPDEEVNACALCGAKFNQLRRRHHCRQCGLIFCAKCCKEKIPLPQLACEEPERVCEQCRPVAEFVTKCRSPHLPFQLESAKGLAHATKDPKKVGKVVELGGVQALITLSIIDNVQIRRHVTAGLHALSTRPALHTMLAEAGAVKAVCRILTGVKNGEDETLCDGISALLIFCKSPELRGKALDDGALGPVLELCTHPSQAAALLALSTLAHIVDNPGTHDTIVSSPKRALPRILALTASDDEQMQEVALKILAHLSTGNDENKHRIVQEDFTSGRSLHKALNRKPKSEQVLCNAACLVANLATGPDDQGGLQELMVLSGDLLTKGPASSELLCHLTRALANFARFRQNSNRLMLYLPTVVNNCLRSAIPTVRTHGLRFLLSLLTVMPAQTTELLLKNGAEEVFKALGVIPGLMEAVMMPLLAEAPEKVKPL